MLFDTLRYYLVPLTTLAGVVGFILGGDYVWLGLATFPILLLFDLILPMDTAPRRIGSPFFTDLPLYLHVGLIVALYGTFIASVMDGSNPLSGPGSGAQIAGSILSMGWLSAVPNLPVAHELMHRRHWFPRRMSQIAGTFYGDPNRDIAHVLTHHLYLDTPKDCDTPHRGQTLYTFVYQATRGSYVDAIQSEASALRRKGLSPWNWRNKTYQQAIMLLAVPGLGLLLGGLMAMVVILLAMLMAKALVEAFNYFQHYGLVRVDGGPILKHHAWNHLGPIVRPLGVEITNHINHHLDGYTKYYNLKPEPDAPQMPSLFLCFILGLIPPLWFALVAKPRLKDWDTRFATPDERKIAMAANARAGWPQWVEVAPNSAQSASLAA